MGEAVQRTVVVSAVNLRKGGTLAILRQCLEYLSSHMEGIRVVALVHSRSLCDYPGIEYVEIPWAVRSWFHRLWCEYVTMHRISRRMADDGEKPWLWLSLHDTTPRVVADHQEVYCHTSFPFMKVKAHDWLMDPKVPLFSMFTRWAYRINIHRNDNIIVQQNWFADAMSRMLGVSREKFRVIPPTSAAAKPSPDASPCSAPPQAVPPLTLPRVARSLEGFAAADAEEPFIFFYASTPDCHKNFETLCEAAARIERKGTSPVPFKVILTVRGDENRYAKWLHKHYSAVEAIDFHGFMNKDELFSTYAEADCFVFPSRVETWGLPISEFIAATDGGGLLLADLPYAHETAGGYPAEYFDVLSASELENLMLNEIVKDI